MYYKYGLWRRTAFLLLMTIHWGLRITFFLFTGGLKNRNPHTKKLVNDEWKIYKSVYLLWNLGYMILWYEFGQILSLCFQMVLLLTSKLFPNGFDDLFNQRNIHFWHAITTKTLKFFFTKLSYQRNAVEVRFHFLS